MTADRIELIEQVADIWADDCMPDISAHACILSARVAVEVLSYFNIPAEAVPVQTVWCNETAWPLVNAGVPHDDWPEEAWSVGVGVGGVQRAVNGYDAHMMTYIDDVGWLDLAVGQFSRPKKGIVLPPTVLLSADPDAPSAGRAHGWRHALITAVPAVHLIWQELDDVSYRQAGDWQRNYRTYAAHIIRRINTNGAR